MMARMIQIIILVGLLLAPLTGLANQSTSKVDSYIDPFTAVEFVKISGGCFQMGSPTSRYGRGLDEGPVHEVCLDDYWMAKLEVSWKQWKLFMPLPENCTFSEGKENFPAEGMTWQEAATFLQKMSDKSTVKEFRLPTEAEWEYAARAGGDAVYHFGDTINPEIVNYDGKYPFGKVKKGLRRFSAAPIGSFPANDFGLHDMHGNVWEYCQDWYDEEYYQLSGKNNPQGPENGTKKIIRGGSWDSDARNCRSTERTKFKPNKALTSFGFRVVISDK